MFYYTCPCSRDSVVFIYSLLVFVYIYLLNVMPFTKGFCLQSTNNSYVLLNKRSYCIMPIYLILIETFYATSIVNSLNQK